MIDELDMHCILVAETCYKGSQSAFPKYNL
jgi:hypothetical protein